MDLNEIIPVLIVGGLFLLSFLKFSNVTKVNRRANIFFGIFTLLWSSFWLDEMIIPRNVENDSYIYIILHLLQFFVATTFYFSVKIYADPGFRFKPRSTFYCIVPLIFLGFLIAEPILNPRYFHFFYTVLFLGHSLFYTVLAYARILKHQKDIEQFHSSTEDIDLRWIKYIIYSFISSSIIITIYSIFTSAVALNIYINLFFLAVVYLVSFYSLRQKEIYPREAFVEPLESSDVDEPVDHMRKMEKLQLFSSEELALLKLQLSDLMENQAPYLDSELNLIKLAHTMDIKSHQLSYLINTGFGTNFFNFINGYRVSKAKELLRSDQHDHLNMLVIGYQSGFNSKTSFNTTFKKMTNMTPSEYRKEKSMR